MAGEEKPIKMGHSQPRLYHFWERLKGKRDSSLSSVVLQRVVAGFSLIYGVGASARRWAYHQKLLPVKRLPRPVVSVGNLTVGGTGKTPMTASLARYFQGRGKRMAILSRGYRGRRKEVTRISDGSRIFFHPPEVGEEAYWLARSLPGAAVYTAPSRYEAGLAAMHDFDPDVFLLDDGFQHFQLHRNLDMVLLDAEAPMGNGHVLPRGRLREPVSALAAAQVLILTRYEADRHQAQLEWVKARFPDKIVLTAAISPTSARLFPGSQEHPPGILHGLPLVAFAGLAQPEVFVQTLEELGVDLKGFRAFPDHYAFTEPDMANLIQEAGRREAGALITTSKDFARLGERWRGEPPLWVLEVEARVDWSVLEPFWKRIFRE